MKRLLIILLVGCDAEPTEESQDTDDVETDGDESSGEETGIEEIVCEDEPVLTFDTFGRGFLATYCDGCHGAQVLDRKGAPPAVVFDDRETVSMYTDRILTRVVPPDGVPPMPPAGGVTEGDLARLRIWLTCYP